MFIVHVDMETTPAMSNHKTPPKEDHRKKKRTRRPPRTFVSLPDEHILSEAEILERLPFERHALPRLIEHEGFPPPIWLSKGKKGFRWSLVLRWIEAREADPIRPRAYFGRSDEPPDTKTA